ncbi:hypothetical protein Tco_0554569 [Tanacetum coccineum]
MDQGKGQTSRADDEGFIEVKKKKPCSNGGTKNFKPVLVKPKTQCRLKAKQSTEGTSNSPRTTHFIGTNKASTSGYNKESQRNTCSFYSLSNSFKALNVNNLIIKNVSTSSKVTTSGTQVEGQSYSPIVEKINVLEKQILDGRLALVDDDVKPLEKVDYPAENETANFFASNGVGYGPKSL